MRASSPVTSEGRAPTRRASGRPVPVLLLVGVLCAGCGGPQAAPGPGTMSGLAPDLRGRRVLVLPVQQNLGVRGDPDAEIAFGLRERNVAVEWVLPGEAEEMLARSPGVPTSLRGLAVGQFLAAEVFRVGDPLYGDLRRLSALVDAEVVLLPVQTSLESEPGADSTVRLWTALIDTRSGRVLWYSILDGEPSPDNDPRGLASAVELMTRSLLWYSVT